MPVTINYPSSLDDATSLPQPTSANYQDDASFLGDVVVTKLSLAHIAIQAVVGIPGSAVTSTHDYKLSGVTGTDKAASTGGTLAQFAATSSAQLRTLLNDETGTGLAYFQDGDIGTPSAGVATNLTGTATGLTAGVATLASTVTVADAASDTTCWIAMVGTQTGSLAILTDGGITYNAATNALTAGSFTGSITASNINSGTLSVNRIPELPEYLHSQRCFSARVAVGTNVTISAPGTPLGGLTFDIYSFNAFILLFGQTDKTENGLWLYNNSAGPLIRPACFEAYNVSSHPFSVYCGHSIVIEDGEHAGRIFRNRYTSADFSEDESIDIGTDNLEYTEVLRRPTAMNSTAGYNFTIPANSSFIVSDQFEIEDGMLLEISDGAIMEIT